jgi:hypothetical protein
MFHDPNIGYLIHQVEPQYSRERDTTWLMHMDNATSSYKSSDTPAGHRLVAYASYPATHSVHEFILKKSPIFIPSASSSPSAASCGYPRPGRGHAHSLLLLLPPYPLLLARPHRTRLTPLPIARDGAGGARSAHRTCHPPDRAKPGAGDTCGSGSRAQWFLCWMLVVLAHCRSLSAPPQRPELIGTALPLFYVANICFKCFRRFRDMFQLFHIDVAKVYYGCCTCYIYYKCCRGMLQAFIQNISSVTDLRC